MDLLPDDAQQEIADATRAFLADAMPIARLRTGAAAARPDAALLARIAELGWFGLGLPETQGGVGCTLAEEALLFREIGRCAGAVQLLATALAARVAAAGGAPERAEALLAGRVRAGWAEPLGPIDLGAAVSGRFQVFDGGDAALWLAVAPSGAALVEASSSAAQARDCLDEFTQLAHAELAAAAPVARVGRAEQIFDRAAVLASAMLVGIAEAARDQAAAYAASRIQFGKPIGVFQAIKHRCADMAVRCEASWGQTCYAALTLRDGERDAAFQVSAAKHLAGEAAEENAAANVQVHGGYGYTTEYDAHVLVKRAHVLAAVAGAPRWHLRRVLDAPTAA